MFIELFICVLNLFFFGGGGCGRCEAKLSIQTFLYTKHKATKNWPVMTLKIRTKTNKGVLQAN